MAFAKKQKVVVVDRRDTKFGALEYRANKIAALAEANTPEARKARKAMNEVCYRKGRDNTKDWFTPKGKKTTAGGKQTRKHAPVRGE